MPNLPKVSNFPIYLATAAAALVLSSGLLGQGQAAAPEPSTSVTLHKTVDVDGLEIFYREAGPKDARQSCCCTAFRPPPRCSGN